MSSVQRLSSPSSNLLRNSRLFALPQPLAPSVTNASSTPINHSETATSPYPTHATLETYRSLRKQGDWGLKRPLPLKSTATRDASYIRIKDGIDTREHITSFEQAGDHVWTLRKFQALNIPVLFERPVNSIAGGQNSTPFEENFISTADPEDLPEAAKRWRTKGPWIAGMSNAEFEKWLYGSSVQGGVIGERAAFMEFVKDRRLEELVDEKITVVLAKGIVEKCDARSDVSRETRLARVLEFLDTVLSQDLRLAKITKSIIAVGDGKFTEEDISNLSAVKESQSEALVSMRSNLRAALKEELRPQAAHGFDHYIRELRAQPNRLLSLIQEYFDLPDTPKTTIAEDRPLAPWTFEPEITNKDNPDEKNKLATMKYRHSGMPKTHPSAGLGYLRLGVPVIENHAVYGPQAQPEAIPARLLKPGVGHTADTSGNPVLGAAGFVTTQATLSLDSKLKEFVSQPGGQKCAVRPTYVSINSDGRPVLRIENVSYAKKVMAGLAKERSAEEYQLERERRVGIQGFDQMPELDSNYSSSARVGDAIRKSREGLRELTNTTTRKISTETMNNKEQDMLSSMLSELQKR